MGINQEIASAKKRLIEKAKESGIYENFGQDEVRKLKDKYSYTPEIEAFDEWCMTFDENKLQSL